MFDQNIGKHCSMDICKQKDWLPVKCKYCNKFYCADHSSIESHSCTNYQKQYKKVFECPMCGKIIDLNHNLSAEQNFEVHLAMDCQGHYEQNVPKPILCVGIKCHTKLTELNSFHCSKCQHKVCLKHRMPEDHFCKVK